MGERMVFDSTRRPVLEIRLAGQGDVPSLVAINHHWIDTGVAPLADRSKGYLSGDRYSYNELSQIVAQSGVSVLTADGVVGGYFLFDDWTDNPMTCKYRAILSELRTDGVLPPQGVCARAQVAIMPEFQALGMYGPLQQYLCDRMADRYSAVFSLVAKDNAKRDVHARFGWRTIGEAAEWRYVIRPTAPV